MNSFQYQVTDSQIADLKTRLLMTRWPDQQPNSSWLYGTDVGYLRDLTDYWLNGFDWRSQEAKLNSIPQLMARVAGINIHTLHIQGKGPNPKPLLLLHGWPGSVFEFIDLIPRLTDPGAFGGNPADAFTVVAPSLPGYGLSFQADQKRFGVRQIGDAAVELMSSLGYSRFGVQGGDWGSLIATSIGLNNPECITGLHLNFLSAIKRDPALYKDADVAVQVFVNQLKQFNAEETGYQLIQGTKPQTLAFGLTDSPVGLAAWLVEKFRSWTDCAGNPENALSRDQMLADISFYWFTGCIGASFWPYYDRIHTPWLIPEGKTVEVPVGYAEFPFEIIRPPRVIAERVFTNIQRWSVMGKGGHFAAMEQPQALAFEITEFFRSIRD